MKKIIDSDINYHAVENNLAYRPLYYLVLKVQKGTKFSRICCRRPEMGILSLGGPMISTELYPLPSTAVYIAKYSCVHENKFGRVVDQQRASRFTSFLAITI